jgi:hypothetical protein
MQKLRSRNRTAPAPARVLDIRNIALDLLGVLVAQRQPPELLAGNLQRRSNFANVSSSFEKPPANTGPSATTHAPVSVAASIRCVQPSCRA